MDRGAGMMTYAGEAALIIELISALEEALTSSGNPR